MEEEIFPRGRGNTNNIANNINNDDEVITTTRSDNNRNHHDDNDGYYDRQMKNNKKKRRRRQQQQQVAHHHHHNDFLFGEHNNDDDDNNKRNETTSLPVKNKKQRRTITNNTKKQPHYNTTTTSGSSSTSSKSMLPLGGAGVHVLTSSTTTTSVTGKKKVVGSTTKNNNNIVIEGMGFSKLEKGMKILGCVRQIIHHHQQQQQNDHDNDGNNDMIVLFSLPNFWTAYMKVSSKSSNKKTNSSYYPPVFQIGEYLALIIVKISQEPIGNIKKKPQQQGFVGGQYNQQQQYHRRIQVTSLPGALNHHHFSSFQQMMTTTTVVLRCQVLSIEDHGLVMDLGSNNRRGFLKYTDIQQDYILGDKNNNNDDKFRLCKGRILDCWIKARNNQKDQSSSSIIPLCLPSREQMIKQQQQQLASSSSMTLSQLWPGTLVHAKVECQARNGLCVTFGGTNASIFRGAIARANIGAFNTVTNNSSKEEIDSVWKELYPTGTTLLARILAVDPISKFIRLSTQPHVLELLPRRQKQSPTRILQLQPGTVIENATVLQIDPGIGALLALPPPPPPTTTTASSKDNDNEDESEDNEMEIDSSSTDDSQAVYVHISKAMDDDDSSDQKQKGSNNNNKTKKNKKTPQSVFASQFAPGTKHTVRILNTNNWMDGIATAAAAPSIITAKVLTYDDIRPGHVYRQVPVVAVASGGVGNVLVELGPGNIRGLIPVMHLFDDSTTTTGATTTTATSSTSDYRRRMQKVKYSVGAKVDVRCLSTDVIAKKCILTAKKSLVKSTHNMIDSFDSVKIGDIATGFISVVDDRGLSVTFVNGVYGRVGARSLATELGIEDHYQDYHIGDVVQCRVVNIKKKRRSNSMRRRRSRFDNDDDEYELDEGDEDVDMDNDEGEATTSDNRFYKELTLSLKVDGQDVEASKEKLDLSKSTAKIQLSAGGIIPAKAMRIVQLVKGKEKDRGFVPGYAIVRLKSKYVLSNWKEDEEFVPYVECKLPFDQMLDHYRDEDIVSAQAMDDIAETMLTIGKKVSREGFVLYDPKKTGAEYYNGTGNFATVSIRPRLVATLTQQLEATDDEDANLILPSPTSKLFRGALLHGYVTQIDKRHGAFVRYLNGLTGLIPKQKGGLLLPMFRTLVTEVVAIDDTASPPKLLVCAKMLHSTEEDLNADLASPIKVGDVIEEAVITKLDFNRASLEIMDESLDSNANVKARLHCTMAQCTPFQPMTKSPVKSSSQVISKFHPFYKWDVGTKLSALKVVSVEKKDNTYFVELTNRIQEKEGGDRIFYENGASLFPDEKVSVIVCAVNEGSGLWVEASPGLTCHIPALEISTDVRVLNSLKGSFPLGCRLECKVIDKGAWQSKRAKYRHGKNRSAVHKDGKGDTPFLSCIESGTSSHLTKPKQGDLIVGRINRSIKVAAAPALMLDLRGGFVGRCCITELAEPDEWINMPLGRVSEEDRKTKSETHAVVSEEDSSVESTNGTKDESEEYEQGEFSHGRFVQCRVLSCVSSRPLVQVSLRSSRLEGDLDSDDEPEEGEKAQAYVVSTTNKGCFMRLSRKIDGRVILKELCDGFLPNPGMAFPPGRLVVGKVKSIKHVGKEGDSGKTMVDMDMRESVLLEHEAKPKFGDIEIGKKYKGVVTRIHDYGVFVRIENSDISGLVHKSECSDSYIKDLSRLYDPGDLVKVVVLKKDEVKKQLGFSMKASHFENDEDSEEDDSSIDEDMDESVEELVAGAAIDSDDEDFASKLAKKMNGDEDSNDDQAIETDSDSDSDSDSEASSSSDEDEVESRKQMDTDVGFDWGGKTTGKPDQKDPDDEEESDSEDDDDSDDDDDDGVRKSSHKSRKKHAQRRREEQETTRRETALADGTADENPETAGDFERLLASSPNSSEIWILYMAFHLSLADIQAAREVANRALDRISFRYEREKLNVWCALLTLELKYGASSGSDFEETMGRACQHNNPKHVYLRVCEMLEKEAGSSSSSSSTSRADDMYGKMCKKFRSKKKVWLAHMEYLLRNGEHEKAHHISKKAMQSLPSYKHVETMSKFAQLIFEHGNPERARTLFDGLLLKYPKRLDLFFVYVDKEVKHGEISIARSLFERVADFQDETMKLKLSDKKMKSFFKKWYTFEQVHGTDDNQEQVKDAARQYVEQRSSISN